MDIGTGIPIGCTILGIVAVAFRIFPAKKKNNNPGSSPNGKYLLEKVFDEYKEGTNYKLQTLTDSVTRIEGGVKRVHKRIDEVLGKV